jgi:hypothetical protein
MNRDVAETIRFPNDSITMTQTRDFGFYDLI